MELSLIENMKFREKKHICFKKVVLTKELHSITNYIIM